MPQPPTPSSPWLPAGRLPFPESASYPDQDSQPSLQVSTPSET